MEEDEYDYDNYEEDNYNYEDYPDVDKPISHHDSEDHRIYVQEPY